MSGRLALPEPDAGWATVCFGGASDLRFPQGHGPDEAAFFVVPHSDTAYGPVLVRSVPLPEPTAERVYPHASLCPHLPGPVPCDVHLWVDADSSERTALMEHADVLVSRVPLPAVSAHRRVGMLLASHPGCLAAAVPDTAMVCVVGVRDRSGTVSFVRPRWCGYGAQVPPHAVASGVHAWAVSGRPPRVAPVSRS